jgi:hypothetical protein
MALEGPIRKILHLNGLALVENAVGKFAMGAFAFGGQAAFAFPALLC